MLDRNAETLLQLALAWMSDANGPRLWQLGNPSQSAQAEVECRA